jgi:uncharacterized protein (DUF433 family)
MQSSSATSPKQHVTSTPNVCGGKPCIAGTRIRVWDVAVLSQAGESPDEILAHYPQLSLSDVYAALAYYYDNRPLIDQQAIDDDKFAEQVRQTMGLGPLEKKLGGEAVAAKSKG